MQFCGIDGITIRKQLLQNNVAMVAKDWINVCAQLAEVVHYLHEDEDVPYT